MEQSEKAMLNFRKLKQDFSSNVVREGKDLFEESSVLSVKVDHLDSKTIRLIGRVQGSFENTYECELEIDRFESEAVDSNCDCPYSYDCQHLAAVLFYLEKHLDQILVDFSKDSSLDQEGEVECEELQEIQETLRTAKEKEEERQEIQYEKELLEEYSCSLEILSSSPFFLPPEEVKEDQAELAILFKQSSEQLFDPQSTVEIQISLRLPFRSKPLNIPNLRNFLDAVRYSEPLLLAGKRYFFTQRSFASEGARLLQLVMPHVRCPEESEVESGEANPKVGLLEAEAFGRLCSAAFSLACPDWNPSTFSRGNEAKKSFLPCLYNQSLECPVRLSRIPAKIHFSMEYWSEPSPKLFLKPDIYVEGQAIPQKEGSLLESARPGVIYENIYYPFEDHIRRVHLRHLATISHMTIPEPLVGSFIEYSLPELHRFAEISNTHVLSKFETLPYMGELKARCELEYLEGELEATLTFLYEDLEIPASTAQLNIHDVEQFVMDQGILGRNLSEERRLVRRLFPDFPLDLETGNFLAKSEKKVVEFMTEIVPNTQDQVEFLCPDNLLDQFLYDSSEFCLRLDTSSNLGFFTASLEVDGPLEGSTLELLWECISARKSFIEISPPAKKRGRGRAPASKSQPVNKILVLDLESISPVVQLLDDLGIKSLQNHSLDCPLWSLAHLDFSNLKDLPLVLEVSSELKAIQKQILGESQLQAGPIPGTIRADLRPYQKEGVHWLERLRQMHLNGVLADDMGLGKTLQAIIAIAQYRELYPESLSLVVCPTSLLYNWKEEFHRFQKETKVLVVDGIPAQRKKLLETLGEYDVIITSYSLLQKDIDLYEQHQFGYTVLDEAQNIKNRGTRNAKSVKQLNSKHKLVLTGTPIENSLEELWSLFDFLMPGLLSSFDRFSERFIRQSGDREASKLPLLRQKVAPFILRRMKTDVLKDLPPVSDLLYHCQLSDVQQELYRSYANSAREELSRLVDEEGFEKIQIHVLATLTRLKQICCHPAIFAKEKAEPGDSAKYDLLFELLQTLIPGGHKTVIFSQYTRMLEIMRGDLEAQGIPFCYLDGSSKNRLEIVRNFNEDPNIPVFLVSLRAGGVGLNLVGADTVIHYDMWWNPAVDDQATSRVHRIGQSKSVSACRLVTLNTIEEKILALQEGKKELVKEVINCDDEAISKLTWPEVLDLLKT